MITMTGLWLNTSKSGEKYFAGNMGGVRVLIFKNKNKQSENHPDYRLVFAENKPMDNADETAQGGYDEDDDIPF